MSGARRKLNQQAFDAGVEAKRNGLDLTACPHKSYPAKSLKADWEAGWRSVAAAERKGVVARVPAPVNRTPVKARPHYVPDGEELKVYYLRYPACPCPCPKCRRVILDDAQQACRALWTRDAAGDKPAHAYLECRGCGHRFVAPIVTVPPPQIG